MLDPAEARELEALAPAEERLLMPEVMEDPMDEATVVSKVEDPEVTVETIAEVVMADAEPAAPPAPKIVVEPTTVEKVESSEVTTEMISDVVMAEEDPPAPPAAPVPVTVEVSVPVGEVAVVITVAEPTSEPQAALEQSRIPYAKLTLPQRQAASVAPQP